MRVHRRASARCTLTGTAAGPRFPSVCLAPSPTQRDLGRPPFAALPFLPIPPCIRLLPRSLLYPPTHLFSLGHFLVFPSRTTRSVVVTALLSLASFHKFNQELRAKVTPPPRQQQWQCPTPNTPLTQTHTHTVGEVRSSEHVLQIVFAEAVCKVDAVEALAEAAFKLSPQHQSRPFAAATGQRRAKSRGGGGRTALV